jgi:hypothetical protein
MSASLFSLDTTAKKLTPIPVRDMAGLGLKETSDLESWLASANADLFGRKVLWIARQDRPSEEQRSDLVGVAQTGDLLVTELKRGRLGEEAITQALCYAADYAQRSAEELAQLFADHSAKATTASGLLGRATSISDAQTLLSKHVGEDAEINESQILLLVAEDFTAKALSVCDYLNEGEGKFSVECWRYSVCQSEDAEKRLFFLLEQIVPPPSIREAIDEKREASKARKRARDPARVSFMRALVPYLNTRSVKAWRYSGQSYECQVEIGNHESWLSVHELHPRFILPTELELDGDPSTLQLTPKTNSDGKVAYEFADVDASKDVFTPGIGDRAVAVIQKLRAKQAPAAGSGAPSGGGGG